MAIDTQRILKHFKGIDALREKKKNEVIHIETKQKAENMYNPDYIEQFKKMSENELIEDRQERANKAKQEIDDIKAELTAKVFNDPYAGIKMDRAEEKILAEMQRDKSKVIVEKELLLADKPNDFKALIKAYGDDEYLYNLITLEVKKRVKNDGDLDLQTMLEHELNPEPKEFQELNKLWHTITFLGNLDKHPVGLEDGNTSGGYEPLI